MLKILKFIFSIFFFILIYLLIYIKSSMPDLREKKFKDLKISFDHSGIPIIESNDLNEALAYMAYCHTIHRRNQMEMLKRFAEGRLSEIFGKRFLEFDKAIRALNLRSLAKSANKNFPSRLLEEYSKIVNKTTAQIKKPLLSKIIKLKFENWKPEDSYLIFFLLLFDLNRNLKQEIFFLKTAGKISPETLKYLFYSSPGKECIRNEEVEELKNIPPVKLAYNFDLLFDVFNFRGSNCWAIGKKFSKNGNPFFSNDLHLSTSFPPFWYILKIKTKNEKIEGFTIPGIPLILIGNTKEIAWGFTSSMADIIDLKIEKNLNLKDLKFRKEKIKIKKKKEVEVWYYEKEKDVLITEPGKNGIFLKFFSEMVFSPFSTFINLYKTKDLEKAIKILKELPICLNVIICTKDGKIGKMVSGFFPERNNSSGFFPSEKIKWVSISNYENVTLSEDFLISANEETNEKISKSWCAPYRYEKLNEEIKSKKWDLEEIKKLQRNVYSKQAEKILKEILIVMPKGFLKERFSKWDFKMEKDSETAYLFEMFYYKLFENLLKDELNDFYYEYLKIIPFSYPALDEAIYKGKDFPLWENIKTKEKENIEDIILKTTKEVENLRPEKWGKVHKLKIGLFFYKMCDVYYPGSLNTINVAAYDPSKGFNVNVIPSMRYIVEFKEDPVTYFEIPGGQSEHIFDKHCKDFLKKYLQ